MDFFDSPRDLTTNDYRNMLLPKQFYNFNAADIEHDAIREVVENYIANMRDMYRNRAGMLICGAPASGKSAIAALLAKEARRRGQPALFITIEELRSSMINRINFSTNQTPMERAKEVSFLVLDGLEHEDRDEKILSLTDISRLIVWRGRNNKITVLTSQVSLKDLSSNTKFKLFLDTVSEYMLPITAPVLGQAVAARKRQLQDLILGD